ncbi:hypothetical protein ACP4OV_021994 [Aristida adscensionis]
MRGSGAAVGKDEASDEKGHGAGREGCGDSEEGHGDGEGAVAAARKAMATGKERRRWWRGRPWRRRGERTAGVIFYHCINRGDERTTRPPNSTRPGSGAKLAPCVPLGPGQRADFA